MDCEKCQRLLSDFHDGALGVKTSAAVDAHLWNCLDCSLAYDELQSIVSVARSSNEHLFTPPNERALWLRIRNTVESEAMHAPRRRAPRRALSLPRLFERSWEFTLPQLVTGVAALVVMVSLVTTLGIQHLEAGRSGGGGGEAAARHGSTSRARAVSAEGAYPHTFIRPHQASLRYWQQRVERQKANWDPRLRESFERSVYVLDQSVNDSLSDLQRNPHDEVAEEMLNAALRDKIDLLKEFGEQ